MILDEEHKMRLVGKIDRMDTRETEEAVYVRIIDYKSGSTSFDLLALYYGLQLQLVVYMDAVTEMAQHHYPDKEIVPAGILYYNIADPLAEKKGQPDPEKIDAEILKKLRMNGLVNSELEVVRHLDRTIEKESDVIPVVLKDGEVQAGRSSVANRERFARLSQFVHRKLKEAGIGTYILFQETYHKESYEQLHPTGPKHDYAYHTEAMDRAMEGGIDDVGLGVLFGLELYRYEFAGLLMHAEHLEAVHGVGPHTISVPRIKRADDIDPDTFDNGIGDEIFAKLCALIRISVPYTGMIISTRESQQVRAKVIDLGVSQISGGSRTSVGGYTEELRPTDTEQFDVSDQRTLDEVVRWLMETKHIPSFCTACYRAGRTGDRFMSLCKSGQIQNCCHPNALITLKEFLEDYASAETRAIGERMIKEELLNIPKEQVRKITEEYLVKIGQGERDFRF